MTFQDTFPVLDETQSLPEHPFTMSELAKAYEPQALEEKWPAAWLAAGCSRTMKTPHCLALALAFTLSPLLAVAPPGILNHQGRIAVSGANYTGTGHFKFALVDAAGTTTLWSNNNSSTGGGHEFREGE